jgi:hypothetical protein
MRETATKYDNFQPYFVLAHGHPGYPRQDAQFNSIKYGMHPYY